MLGTILIAVIISVLMIGANALYVAGEFSSVSARKSRIAQLAQDGNRLAAMLLPVIQDPHRLDSYIAASQVGITLSSIVLGIYGQRQIAPLIEPLLLGLPFLSQEVVSGGLSALIVLIFLTILQVVLGELVPKSVAIRYPERIALATVVPMRWSADIILKPFIIILNGSGLFILRLLGASYSGHNHIHSPEEIRFLIGQSYEGGLLDADDRQLLDNAFRVSELTAGEIMVPRTRLVAAAQDSPLEDILKIALESDYTRIPVYENTIDNLVGFVHLKDLFSRYRSGQATDVSGILRQAPYVPETMLSNEVWETMNRERSYLVFVFDEYGGTAGMITREDLIEELFGELQDEFDAEQAPITPLGDGRYLIRGDVLIDVVNERLDLDLPADNANTIGGLVLHELGHVPLVGEDIDMDGVKIHVEQVNGTSVEEVRLVVPGQPPTPVGEGV